MSRVRYMNQNVELVHYRNKKIEKKALLNAGKNLIVSRVLFLFLIPEMYMLVRQWRKQHTAGKHTRRTITVINCNQSCKINVHRSSENFQWTSLDSCIRIAKDYPLRWKLNSASGKQKSRTLSHWKLITAHRHRFATFMLKLLQQFSSASYILFKTAPSFVDR